MARFSVAIDVLAAVVVLATVLCIETEAGDLSRGQEMLELPVRVVDQHGVPVRDVRVTPWALRCSQGHGLWVDNDKGAGVSPQSVLTDRQGMATVRYPRFRNLHEETATLTVSINVDHPRFAFVGGVHIDVPLENAASHEVRLPPGIPV